jgi:hypothetical protein
MKGHHVESQSVFKNGDNYTSYIQFNKRMRTTVFGNELGTGADIEVVNKKLFMLRYEDQEGEKQDGYIIGDYIVFTLSVVI